MRYVFIAITILLITFAGPADAMFSPHKEAGKILLIKSERQMYVFDKNGKLIKRYNISLGKTPDGHKQRRGDNRTPEGRYVIEARNPNSKYHLSLKISYPNRRDISRAKRMGYNPGGDIFIHGLPNGKEHLADKYKKDDDWTNGCVAVDNQEIQELWNIVPDGTPILILP